MGKMDRKTERKVDKQIDIYKQTEIYSNGEGDRQMESAATTDCDRHIQTETDREGYSKQIEDWENERERRS